MSLSLTSLLALPVETLHTLKGAVSGADLALVEAALAVHTAKPSPKGKGKGKAAPKAAEPEAAAEAPKAAPKGRKKRERKAFEPTFRGGRWLPPGAVSRDWWPEVRAVMDKWHADSRGMWREHADWS